MRKASFLRNDDQRRTIDSIKALVPGRFYSMEYFADYCLDEAMAMSPTTLDDFNGFAAKHLLNIPDTNTGLQGFGAGCSVFAGRNREGEPLLVRGYDYSHQLTAALVTCHPKDGYTSMGMCDLAFMGIGEGALEAADADCSSLMLAPYVMADGVNEKGLSVAALELSYKGVYPPSDKPKLCGVFVPRLVLDRAATVKEALDLLSQYDIASPFPDFELHFMLADASGVTKVIEMVQGEMKVYDAKCVANEYLTPNYHADPEMPRYNIMKEFLKLRRGVFSADEAMSVLRTVSLDKTIGVGESITRWSAVFNLANKTMDLCYDRDYETKYHFSL